MSIAARVKAFLRSSLQGTTPAQPPPFDLQEYLLTIDFSDYGVIHKPTSGCPIGWTEAKGMFRQNDGSSLDGCVNPSPDRATYAIDVLMGGESIQMGIKFDAKPATVEGTQPDSTEKPTEAKLWELYT